MDVPWVGQVPRCTVTSAPSEVVAEGPLIGLVTGDALWASR